MDALLAELFKFLLAGGVAAAVAVWIARNTGERWLQAQFDKQLEAFKAAQQREMEHLRYRINSYFDRAVRLHEMEFEVLPKIWRKLFDAFHEAVPFCNYGRMINNLNKMRPVELDAFLAASPLHDFQKDDVRQASDKTARYYELEHRHELVRVKRHYYSFTRYFMKNAIFLTNDVEQKLNELRDIIFAAITEKEFRHDYKGEIGDHRYEKFEHLKKRGEELMAEIQQVVRAALQDSKQTTLFAD